MINIWELLKIPNNADCLLCRIGMKLERFMVLWEQTGGNQNSEQQLVVLTLLYEKPAMLEVRRRLGDYFSPEKTRDYHAVFCEY